MTAAPWLMRRLPRLLRQGEQAPRIISMDVDDGPRWAETDIIPIEPADLREPSTDTIGLLMYTSGTTGSAQRGFTIACQFDRSWHQCCGCA